LFQVNVSGFYAFLYGMLLKTVSDDENFPMLILIKLVFKYFNANSNIYWWQIPKIISKMYYFNLDHLKTLCFFQTVFVFSPKRTRINLEIAFVFDPKPIIMVLK